MFEYILIFTAIICVCINAINYHKTKKNKILVSIEGNIGVGKTSLMNLLKNSNLNAEFIYEPVDEWLAIKDDNGKDLLQTFYDDKKRWAYTFQNVAYITRMMSIIDKIKNSSKKYIIIDRSLQADLNTFAKMLYDDQFLTSIEWNAYHKWNTFFEKYFGNKITHKIIYLRSDPQIAFQRMKIRSRDAEQSIPFDYLKLLHKYHDNWLLNHKSTLILDVNVDFIKDKQRANNVCNQIISYLGAN